MLATRTDSAVRITMRWLQPSPIRKQGCYLPNRFTSHSALVRRVRLRPCMQRSTVSATAATHSRYGLTSWRSRWQPSDNYFHIAPGSERTILLTTSGDGTRLSGHVTALNASTPLGFHAP